jgi:predicted RNA binding protein YcfA (HicA-like mRNA interferase family)
MKLPRNLSGRDIAKALGRLGFSVTRQTGSHLQMEREKTHVTVPMHNPVRTGTLKSVLRQAGITIDELLGAL